MANLIHRLIHLARERGGSDLHMIAGLQPAIRVHGELNLVNVEPLTVDHLRDLIYELLNEEQIKHLESEWELCFSLFDEEVGRLRVTVYYHSGHPELSVRLCPIQIPSREQLGLPEAIDDLARHPHGLVLLTGPTGVGKTTTLNYMVDLINHDRRCKIITIEDPVEFVHRPNRALIVQQEVHLDTHSFSRALNHVLRQDPDVIVVGEMRNLETISTALMAAETGHLVLATLHTPNVMQTMERITSAFDDHTRNMVVAQLANCLRAVVAQDLIITSDGKSRVLAYEILLSNSAVRNIIRESKIHQLANVISTSTREGMITMDACLIDLYQKARISYDAAYSRMAHPEALRNVNKFREETAQ